MLIPDHPTDRVAEVQIHRQPDGTIDVVDRVDRKRIQFQTENSSELSATVTERFLFPIDAAVRFQAGRMTVADLSPVFIRTDTGELVEELISDDRATLAKNSYVVEMSGVVKCYIEFTGAFTAEVTTDGATFLFDPETELFLGARSHHERPATTVQTSSDPTDLMRAISTFGSAMKTMSPERSFPTLRGHPPRIELADAFHAPPGLQPPCPEISIGVRPVLNELFAAAPLAYYLGAHVVPTESPSLAINGETCVDFDRFETVSDGLNRTLSHVFTLDCLVRSAGLYPMELREQSIVEGSFDLDLDALYHRSPNDRVRDYLAIPFEPIAAVAPPWHQCAHFIDHPRSVVALPSQVNRLAQIRVHSLGNHTDVSVESPSLVGEIDPRSLTPPLDQGAPFPGEHRWIGPGFVRGCTTTRLDWYDGPVDRDLSDGDLSVAVVCNDNEFSHEVDVLQEMYGTKAAVDLDVTIFEDLTCDELAEVLSSSFDFLHYIGHLKADRFVCNDGNLDPYDIDTVGVSSVLLNACSSYRVGCALIDQGALAGIVTIGDVIDRSAAWMGLTLGRLLNIGYPLESALTLIRSESLVGDDYLVIGDGRSSIVQPRLLPLLVEIETDDSQVCIQTTMISTDQMGFGSLTIPLTPGERTYSLISKTRDTTILNPDDLYDYLTSEELPVRLDGELRWSSEVVKTDWFRNLDDQFSSPSTSD